MTVVDENEDALGRLGDDWTGEFLVGHGMDLQLLREAGIEEADAVVVTTDGDNTNIVIAPGGAEALRGAARSSSACSTRRAREFYASRGLRTSSARPRARSRRSSSAVRASERRRCARCTS